MCVSAVRVCCCHAQCADALHRPVCEDGFGVVELLKALFELFEERMVGVFGWIRIDGYEYVADCGVYVVLLTEPLAQHMQHVGGRHVTAHHKVVNVRVDRIATARADRRKHRAWRFDVLTEETDTERQRRGDSKKQEQRGAQRGEE